MIIYTIILIILISILYYLSQNSNEKKEQNINYEQYISNKYIMTQTELKFYRELKNITDKLELSIFPQINLERLINVKDNNNKDRNRIKSKSIDYTIVNNNNCKVICCIELDDYTHNRTNVKIKDNFKDELFEKVNIPLHRIKVNNNYDLENLEKLIKGDIKQ